MGHAGAVARLDNDYQTLFQLAPVSLWLEDFSAVRQAFDRLRADGVTDLRAHLRANPAEVARCSALIRVLDVNRRTLELFRARGHAPGRWVAAHDPDKSQSPRAADRLRLVPYADDGAVAPGDRPIPQRSGG